MKRKCVKHINLKQIHKTTRVGLGFTTDIISLLQVTRDLEIQRKHEHEFPKEIHMREKAH